MAIQEKKEHVGRRNNIIVVVLSVLLIVVVGLFFMQRKEHQSLVEMMNSEKDSIQMELSGMVLGYDSLQTENDTLNLNIELAQTRVKDLLLEVNQVKKASYTQIAQYRKEVTTMRTIMRNYIVQIDSLNQRNLQLMAENRQVKQQFSEAQDVNKQLAEEKERLEQKVSLAAQLEAYDLSAVCVNKKGKETSRSSKAEKIKVSMVLSKNVTAKRGLKKIYVRIQQPNEVVLLKSTDNLFQFEDLRIPYSAMREVEYEGLELPINIFWDNANEAPLVKGIYTVDIFADGNNIGTTRLEVK